MTQPLQNKVFISTRPKGSSEELTQLLTNAGATVLEFPLIKIKAAPLSEDEQKYFTKLDTFHWLILTSSNGVRYFFDLLMKLNGNHNLPTHMKIAVIGEKTGAGLKQFGYNPQFVNPGATAEDFAEPFFNHIKSNTSRPKILLPLGNLARTVIQDRLKMIADCIRVNIYLTETPRNRDKNVMNRILNDHYDMLIFTSPSGIHNFVQLFPAVYQKQVRVACIGSITAEAAQQEGIQPLVVARHSSSEGIVESIIQYYISNR